MNMTKKILNVIAGTPDNPLIIGNIEIPCYVLEDETRVLVSRSVVGGLGMSSSSGGHRLTKFLASNSINPFINNDLKVGINNPIKFRAPGGTAFGYPAIILADICEAVLEARAQGVLQKQQLHIAERCEILTRAFFRIGIIGMIDEITCYQEIRARNALAKILEDFIARELQPWTKTFPLEFYQEIFRLKNWSFPQLANGKKPKTPQVIGKYTNDIVYERLAPGVLKELKVLNPVVPGRGRRNRHTQWFTPDIGHPKLKEHLAAVMAIMRISSNWRVFRNNLQKSFPMKGDQEEIETEENKH